MPEDKEKQFVTPDRRPVPAPSAQDRVIEARELLGETGSVAIRHHGQVYTLRETRQGKLILNK